MKCYMSVPGARILVPVGPVRDGQHAETEARMLLSETETGSFKSIPDHASKCCGCEWALPLAESLAAFIGADLR